MSYADPCANAHISDNPILKEELKFICECQRDYNGWIERSSSGGLACIVEEDE